MGKKKGLESESIVVENEADVDPYQEDVIHDEDDVVDESDNDDEDVDIDEEDKEDKEDDKPPDDTCTEIDDSDDINDFVDIEEDEVVADISSYGCEDSMKKRTSEQVQYMRAVTSILNQIRKAHKIKAQKVYDSNLSKEEYISS